MIGRLTSVPDRDALERERNDMMRRLDLYRQAVLAWEESLAAGLKASRRMGLIRRARNKTQEARRADRSS